MEEKRTECVYLYVTKEIKEKLEMYSDDEKMKEKIILEYIEREKDWMKESLKDLDENELLYRCDLVKIKDDFKKAHDEYVKEIESLYDEAYKQEHILKDKLSSPKQIISEMREELSSFKEELNKLPTYYSVQKIKETFQLIKEYQSMSKEDKELLIKIINIR